MARLARVVIAGMPHHVTQRGNRRQATFFCDEDYSAYLELMGQWCQEVGVAIWAYCLMPNHVHLIAVPKSADGLRRGIGEAHRRYTRRVNFREGWRGHLWQGRFASFVMDEPYLLAAARYIELNPVRAGLVVAPSDYRWSSARAHLKGKDDALVQVAPLLAMTGKWRQLLTSAVSEEQLRQFREHERTGRVLGDDAFQRRLEKKLGRVLRRQKPGPKRQTAE
ncbi:MAG: transposase [Pirellulaceae bacterium]|jgi:putative transposase|nr:transposase [Thermoguttaceae bacterium]NLZ01275.1 transposase [Pirellulaceae bacterium]